ncbi:MAG: leucine-rich repeat protein [Saccharofermentanales bacterium]
MKTRFAALFLVISMIVGIYFNASDAADYVEGSFKFEILTNSVVITGYIGRGGTVVIPNSIYGYKVSAIGYSAFLDQSAITSLTIPETVIRFEEQAFKGCTGLASINIPEGVGKIGKRAFSGCSSLLAVDIPDGLLLIEEAAFSGCSSLTSITIPSKVTAVGDRAFSDCIRLETVFIPDSIKTIGNYAFVNCDSLNEIYIPGNVTHIGEKAFLLCDDLSKINVSDQNLYYKSVDGILYDMTCSELIYYPNALDDEFVVPDYVTRIAADAFNQDESLTKVTLGSNVTEIGKYAFAWCTNLKTMILTDSLLHIGDEAFTGDYYLENVVLPINLISIGKEAFMSCHSFTEINIPASVASIGNAAFVYDYQITGFKVSEDNSFYKSIDGVIFSKDSKYILHYPGGKAGEYQIPEPVEVIGKHAFRGSSGLAGVAIPDSVVTIEDYAFTECRFLGSATIPAGVNYIGEYAFGGCLLENAVFLGDAPDYAGGWLFDNPDNPDSMFQIFYHEGTSGWSDPWNGYTTIMLGETRTATFLNSDLSTYRVLEVPRGDFITLPEDPQMPDKVFRGWYTEGLTAIYEFSALRLSEDMTFYSGWMDKRIDEISGSIGEESGIDLSWSTADGAQFYEVLYAEGTPGEFALLHDHVTSNTMTVSDSMLHKGSIYRFTVRACSGAGENSVYSDYSNVVTVDYFITLPVLISSDILLVDRVMQWISGISTGMTVDSFLNSLKDKTGVTIYQGSRIMAASELIGTGMIVQKKQGSNVVDEFRAVVSSDLNGDGCLSLTDFIRLKSHLLGKTLLKDVNLQAADLNKSGNVSLTDFVQMKSLLLKGSR